MFRAPCLLALVLFVLYTPGVEGCPPKWNYFQGHCYHWFAEKVNWMEAELTCKFKGADLVQVDSKDENEWLANNYKSEIIWIGGIDWAQEGTWKWIATGEKVNYTNWANKEPNNFEGKEHCLHMHFHHFTFKEALGDWNDFDCSGKYSFICEKCSS